MAICQQLCEDEGDGMPARQGPSCRTSDGALHEAVEVATEDHCKDAQGYCAALPGSERHADRTN